MLLGFYSAHAQAKVAAAMDVQRRAEADYYLSEPKSFYWSRSNIPRVTDTKPSS